MDYKDIKTPEDLLRFMNIIEYGFMDEDGIRYGSWDEDAFENNVTTKWRLSSPERLVDVKLGHCFDQVEFERDWFKKNGYNYKTYYIMFLFDEPNEYTTHTFLIYEDSGLWKLFEHSDYFNRGIHKFESLNEALEFEVRHHIEMNKQNNEMNDDVIKHLHIFQYDDMKYNISFDDFIDEILENGTDVTKDIID